MKSYKIITNPVFVGDDSWKIEKINLSLGGGIYNNAFLEKEKQKEKYKILWDIINEFDTFTRRIFFLKYDYDFKILRTNSLLAELMCCSEEQVRLKIISAIIAIRLQKT